MVVALVGTLCLDSTDPFANSQRIQEPRDPVFDHVARGSNTRGVHVAPVFDHVARCVHVAPVFTTSREEGEEGVKTAGHYLKEGRRKREKKEGRRREGEKKREEGGRRREGERGEKEKKEGGKG